METGILVGDDDRCSGCLSQSTGSSHDGLMRTGLEALSTAGTLGEEIFFGHRTWRAVNRKGSDLWFGGSFGELSSRLPNSIEYRCE